MGRIRTGHQFWRQLGKAQRVTEDEAFERLASFLALRAGWEDTSNPTVKARNAGSLFASAVRLARDLCGEELLREVYGASDAVARQQQLRLLARRLDAASWLFLPFHDEPHGLLSIADEATAVASGDAPHIFAPLGRRVRHRLLMARLDALRWDAYLDGLDIDAEERRQAIKVAYGYTEWETIRRRWKTDIKEVWGAAVDRRLAADRRDGSNGLRRWQMRPGEAWQSALTRSGERYCALR